MIGDPELNQFLGHLCNGLGKVYGTTQKASFLGSLIAMEQPRTVVELGTGTGTCAFHMCSALRFETGGQMFSIDNYAHNPELKREIESFYSAHGSIGGDLLTTFSQTAEKFGLDGCVTFIDAHLDVTSESQLQQLVSSHGILPIDLLYCDIEHGPDVIMHLWTNFLPMMNESSTILFDSASTHIPSYLALEKTIDDLNSGKVPHSFMTTPDKSKRWELFQLVQRRRFRLVHFAEPINSSQNSLALIQVYPVDWLLPKARHFH